MQKLLLLGFALRVHARRYTLTPPRKHDVAVQFPTRLGPR